MESKNLLIEVNNVSFKYNHELVLENITLEIEKGSFLGIIGPNGSGKTTLLKIILGLLKPTSGNIKLLGKVGYVPQKAGSQVFEFPVTVEEIVGMAGRVNVDEALAAVEMRADKHTLVKELSGGQQQRVFIARAIAGKPDILILDEPTSGVDANAQASFYQLLQKLNKDLKMTLILVSHDIDVVTNQVDTIACLNKKLICNLSPKKFNKEDYLEDVYGKNLKYVTHEHHHHGH